MRSKTITKTGGPPDVSHMNLAHKQIRNFHTVYEIMSMFMGLL